MIAQRQGISDWKLLFKQGVYDMKKLLKQLCRAKSAHLDTQISIRY